MEDLFRQFWWLMFPIFGFGMGAFSLWMRYRQQQAWLELIKTYAAQGKEPPEAVARLQQTDTLQAGWWCSPRGPYRDWRRVIFFGALAVGFALVAQMSDRPRAVHDFQVVAVIMGVLAAASLLLAILGTVMAKSASGPNGR